MENDQNPKEERDVEVTKTRESFAQSLRRAADAIEKGESFRIQIAGERFTIPADAEFSIEHERSVEDGRTEEEVEFQFKWTY